MLEDRRTTGTIFNLQKFSVHDGAGIRTVVFLKGCPARCQWCSNPESQSRAPELGRNSQRCITAAACGRCEAACKQGAIQRDAEDRVLVNRTLCRGCAFPCADACPTGALTVYGREQSVEQVLDSVEQDSLFYSRSGGGMTLSGGEPLMQPRFAIALLREARRRHIHTAVETCGHCEWEVLEQAAQHLDLVLFDIKCMDSAKHRAFTEVPNDLILSNFEALRRRFPDLPLAVRTPVVPGFNDTAADIKAIRDFIGRGANVSHELLPYHRMGQPKYGYLGRQPPVQAPTPSEACMDRLRGVAAGQDLADGPPDGRQCTRSRHRGVTAP